MGRGYVLHGKDRLFLGLFLDLLFLWDLHRGRGYVQVIKVHIHIRHVGKLGKIHASLCHRIKSFLHAIMTQVHSPGHGYHGTGLALRPAAHIADLLIFVIFLIIFFILTGWFHIFGIVFVVQVSSPLCNKHPCVVPGPLWPSSAIGISI